MHSILTEIAALDAALLSSPDGSEWQGELERRFAMLQIAAVLPPSAELLQALRAIASRTSALSARLEHERRMLGADLTLCGSHRQLLTDQLQGGTELDSLAPGILYA